MLPSSTLCRVQEAYCRDRATNSPLDNVRIIARNAAIAWAQEALAAESREERLIRTRSVADAIATQKRQDREEEENRSFSENPDRGFANI